MGGWVGGGEAPASTAKKDKGSKWGGPARAEGEQGPPPTCTHPHAAQPPTAHLAHDVDIGACVAVWRLGVPAGHAGGRRSVGTHTRCGWRGCSTVRSAAMVARNPSAPHPPAGGTQPGRSTYVPKTSGPSHTRPRPAGTHRKWPTSGSMGAATTAPGWQRSSHSTLEKTRGSAPPPAFPAASACGIVACPASQLCTRPPTSVALQIAPAVSAASCVVTARHSCSHAAAPRGNRKHGDSGDQMTKHAQRLATVRAAASALFLRSATAQPATTPALCPRPPDPRYCSFCKQPLPPPPLTAAAVTT